MTKRIYILQYRADKQDGHWLDDAIAAWTSLFNWGTPPHSHSELCFPSAMCFSSASRGYFIGCRWIDFEQLTKHKERWDVYAKDITQTQERLIRDRISKICGRPYYYVGLFLDFFLPFGWISAIIGKKLNEWYCSQAVWYALTGERCRVSPRRLAKWAIKKLDFTYKGNLSYLRINFE